MAHQHLTFAGFFFLHSLSRGVLLSVIPLQTLALMGDAQRSSTLLFGVSAGGIVAALLLPIIIRGIGNYRAYLIASTAMIVSAALMANASDVLFPIGLFVHVFSIAAAEVTLTLYVLARVRRADMTRFEPMRMLSMVLALSVGPFAGVYLQQEFFQEAPFVVCAGVAVVSLTCFHLLGLHRETVPRSTDRGANPLRHVRRFVRQPRLRLAYGLILAKSAWWNMFVIYVPIYAAQTGLGELAGAAIVSLASAWTLSVPLWGWFGRRYGIRTLMRSGFVAASALSMLAYLVADHPWVTAVVLCMAALGTTMLDGAGHVLFFRAVRSRERAEMAAVFATVRDTSKLTTPGIFALLLNFMALPVVFSTAALWMFVAAGFTRYIPRGMR